MIRKVKILGLQRSGTNWLTQLVKKNLDVQVYEDPLQPFFKHALPFEDSVVVRSSNEKVKTPVPEKYIQSNPDELFIVVYKPAELWVKSIEKKRVDLEQKRPFIFDTNGAIDKQEALLFWNSYMKAWTDLQFPNLVVVSYLDVLENFTQLLAYLVMNSGIEAKRHPFVNIRKVAHSKRFLPSDRKNYLKHKTA